MKHIGCFSGGKDSTALMLLKRHLSTQVVHYSVLTRQLLADYAASENSALAAQLADYKLMYKEAKESLEEACTERDEAQAQLQQARAALRQATICPTCDGTGKMTIECESCCYGEIPNPAGGVCTCQEETCAQCDGKGWSPNNEEAIPLVESVLSLSPAAALEAATPTPEVPRDERKDGSHA